MRYSITTPLDGTHKGGRCIFQIFSIAPRLVFVSNQISTISDGNGNRPTGGDNIQINITLQIWRSYLTAEKSNGKIIQKRMVWCLTSKRDFVKVPFFLSVLLYLLFVRVFVDFLKYLFLSFKWDFLNGMIPQENWIWYWIPESAATIS